MLEWTGAAKPGVQAVYPTEGFNWAGAACRIAEAWMDGPPVTEVSAGNRASDDGDLAAAG